jgi:hypothetical protein
MSAIETLLRECGVTVTYAAVDGVRVHPGNAYHANSILTDDGVVSEGAEPPWWPRQSRLCLVECGGPAIDRYRSRDAVADHHRPGDSGHGRPPSEFLTASSLGQIIAWLANCRALPQTDIVTLDRDIHVGDIVQRRDGCWVASVARGSSDYRSADERGLRQADYTRVWVIPADLVLTAAADHCLGAAYRGECPGVDPDALMAWRVQSRAAFQGVSPETILTSIVAAREALAAAPIVWLTREEEWRAVDAYGQDPEYSGAPMVCEEYETLVSHGVRDMRRDTPVPELPEAATRDGVSYISGPLIGPDGRRKFTCSGTAEVVDAFMRVWGPANGLIDIYGDPARGFAGGYSC